MPTRLFKLIAASLLIPLATITSSQALANDADGYKGALDEKVSLTSIGDSKKTISIIKKEQKILLNANHQVVKGKAEAGERLAQVVMGAGFADEAQTLTFAPIAANDALSDALRWYARAAQRGYPGAPSLDKSGVSFYPVRVVRNR